MHDVTTLVLPTNASATCLAWADKSGAEIAAGLRDLANRIEGLSPNELSNYRGASVVHEHQGFYINTFGGRFETLSWIGDGDRNEIVVIGDTIEKAKEVVGRNCGVLGGGLVCCDDWDVALGHAINLARKGIGL